MSVGRYCDTIFIILFPSVDACSSQPCHNGANCNVTGDNAYECQCTPGFFGMDCGKGKNHFIHRFTARRGKFPQFRLVYIITFRISCSGCLQESTLSKRSNVQDNWR